MKAAHLRAVLIISFLIGAILGGLILYVTWQHNPQCEFHCEGVIHWDTWLPYGAAYAIVGVVVAIPLVSLGVFTVLRCARVVRALRRQAGGANPS